MPRARSSPSLTISAEEDDPADNSLTIDPPSKSETLTLPLLRTLANAPPGCSDEAWANSTPEEGMKLYPSCRYQLPCQVMLPLLSKRADAPPVLDAFPPIARWPTTSVFTTSTLAGQLAAITGNGHGICCASPGNATHIAANPAPIANDSLRRAGCAPRARELIFPTFKLRCPMADPHARNALS